MAEIVAYKIVVESDLANKSVGQLKSDFKDLTDQLNRTKVGTEEYKKTLQSLGVVKGGLQDLKEQVLALNPEKTAQAFAKLGGTVASGFAAGQAAVALFGAESEDLTRVLVRVQAATALASGIQGLSGFGKALQTAGLAMKAFALSNPFTAIAAAVTALVAVIYGLVSAYKDANSEAAMLEDVNKKLTKSYEDQRTVLENEIKILEAYGTKQDEVIKKKRELLVISAKETALALALAEAKLKEAETYSTLDALMSIFGAKKINRAAVEAKEEIKIQKQKLDEIKTDMTVSFIQEDNLIEGRAKKQKELLENLRPDNILGSPSDDPFLIIAEKHGEMTDAMIENTLNLGVSNKRFWQDQIADAEKAAAKRIAQEQYVANLKFQIQKQSADAIGNLTNTIFENAILGAKGNAKREYDIKKQQFQFNKALSATEAAIDTIGAVQKNYKQGGLAIGSALNIAQIAIGAANVAAILAKKYPPFEGGGGADASSPNAGSSGGVATPPSFQKPEGTGINKNEQGDFVSFEKTQAQRVYVVESDISRVQSRVKVIEQNAKY